MLAEKTPDEVARGEAASNEASSDETARGEAAQGEVLVRYFAAARAAAGVETDRLPAGVSLNDVVERLGARHGERLAKVFGVASFLVDGVSCHDRRVPLAAGTTVDVLPPFAGG